MKSILLALMVLTSTVAFAAPQASAPKSLTVSTEDLLRTIVTRHVLLPGLNSIGTLGSDTFAMKMGALTIKADLLLNTPGSGANASANPGAFHMNLSMIQYKGAAQTVTLRYAGVGHQSVVGTRIVMYEAPVNSRLFGRGRMVIAVNQSRNSPSEAWKTNKAYAHFLR